MFKVPDSDDLPSTPPRDQLLFSNHPKSTTPSHEPPTYLTNVSTTPLGPPPRSVYGSSFNGANDTFLRSKGTPLKGFALPQSSPPQEEDEDAEGEEDDMIAPSYAPRVALSSMLNSPRGFKRSRSGKVQPRHESDIPMIAQSLAKQSGPAPLDEPDDFILRSEDIVAALDGKARNQPIAELDSALSSSSAQLTSLWSQFAPPSTDEGSMGPAGEDLVAQASYVASFLLQVHHPHSAKPVQPAPSTRFPRTALGQRAPTSAIPFPKALLDWLNAHHNPYPDDYDSILMTQPAPSSSESFWDIAFSLALRGKFARLIRLLKDARFEHAVTALDDGAARPGYQGRQLESTEALIAHCIGVLELCPALKHENWDVKGNDWAIFRQSVRRAINELEEFAGDDDDDEDQDIPSNAFAQSAKSERQRSLNFSTASRRAESKIPWTIYESLRSLYGQMLGSTDEIVLVSQDWLEACVYLTVWWDGEDEMEPSASVSRSGLRRSTATKQRTREVDVAPLAAYRNKLYDAYVRVTSNPEDSVFQVDTMDPTLVALACVMEDNVEGAVALLRTWSLPVAASVVEIGALGAWLPQGRPRSRGLVEQGFSSEDLMVLSHGPSSQKPVSDIERDGILLQYADALSGREAFQGASGAAKEGWELAVSVLGRLDDGVAAQRKISEMLEAIELKDDVRVDKVLVLCSDLGLSEQARAISERYADSLTDSPQAYGTALIFYARAHIASKLKGTLALLTSLSLVQSAAVPSTSQMDPQLASLLTKDRPGFVRLARSDPKAATLLSSNFSGYATLRKFYDLRDQDVHQSGSSNTQHLRPLERKREAAKALMAVIESAADCIRGGLFDPEVESAIPADALLVLLGETLPLLSTEQRVFSKSDVYTLLRIVEDFSTAPARIRDRAEDLFRASGSSYRGGGGGGGDINSLKKSKSDCSTGSGSSYDMLASSVMALSQEHGKARIARGWDWRKGLDGAGGASVGSKEVLAVLRLALSQEVARGMTGRY